MDAKTKIKVNHFGKVGKLIMNVLLVVGVVVTLICAIGTVYVESLPKDALKVAISSQAKFEVNENNFSSLWSMLAGDTMSYTTNQEPNLNGNQILPAENTDINTQLKLFDQTYTSANIHSEDASKIIEATSDLAYYYSKDLGTLLALVTLFMMSVVLVIAMLKRVFKVLAICQTPFCNEFVSKLRYFGYSLVPLAIIASVEETYSKYFLSAGKNMTPSIQWGVLIAFGIMMFLVVVFNYGVQLQKESDETL